MSGKAGSNAGSAVMIRPCAVLSTRVMNKNGFPITSGSAQAKSGSGTVTPAAHTARNTANSSRRDRLDGTPVAASVRSTSRCAPAKSPPLNSASMPQFCWIAPPASRSQAMISTFSAPLASARNRASCARSNGSNGVAAIDRENRAGHIGTGGRAEEQQRAIEIRRLSETTQRYAPDQRLAGVGLEEFAVEIGLDIAWRQRVDENAVARQLHRQHMRQMRQTCLRRAIARHAADRARREDRRDIDDAA